MARKSWLARAIESFRSPAPKAPTPTNEIEVVSSFLTGRPVSIDDFDPKRLMDEGYRRNVIVYTCVNEIASSAAAPRVYLRDRKTQDEVEEHPLLDLLARPAPALSFYELMETLLIHQQTAGTGYLHKGRNGSGQIVQLKTARPDRIQPVPDRQGNLLWYEYRIEGAIRVQRIEPDDLAPFKLPDPLNDFHGLSPLHVAAIYGDIDTAAAQYLRDFFANGAMPMGLLKFKVPSVRREDRLRVQQEWGEIYGAGEINPNRGGRWHNVGVLGGDVEYQAIASEPAQLRLDAVWGMTESRLCATFGVPPQLVQARIGLQYSTYSNMREARRSFWTETLVPIYRRLGDTLTRNIVSEYDEGLDLVFDLESIPELQEDLNQRADRASKLFLGGLASFNEARLLSDLKESKTDFYAFPQSIKMVSREEVESGAFLEEPEPEPPGAPPPGAPPPPPGEEVPPGEEEEEEEEGPPLKPGEEGEEGERQAGLPFEVLGLGAPPEESEREILRATATLLAGFNAAVREAVEGSDADALAAALAAGDWRRAEKAVAVERFTRRYGDALRDHLTSAASTAYGLHYRHHAGPGRETHHLDHNQKTHAGGGVGGGGDSGDDVRPKGATMTVGEAKAMKAKALDKIAEAKKTGMKVVPRPAKMDPTTANGQEWIAETLTVATLANEAGEAMQAAGLPMEFLTSTIVIRGANRRNPSALAVYSTTDRRIEINTGHPAWGSTARMGSLMNELGGSGFLSTSDPRHAIVHEVGHQLHAMSAGFSLPEGMLEPPYVAGIVRGSKISRYGQTNRREFVAEQFALRVLAPERWRALPKHERDLYGELGGPKMGG